MSTVTLLYYIKRGRLHLSRRVDNEVYNLRSKTRLVLGSDNVGRWNIFPGCIRRRAGVDAYTLVCELAGPLVGFFGIEVVVKYFLCVLSVDFDDAILQ